MRRLVTVPIALAFIFAGCASTPTAPDRTHISSGLTGRTGIDGAGLGAGREWTSPPGASLDDGLAMDEAVAIALWNNPDFQAALTSLGIARADVAQAGMLKNPVLSLLFPLGPKQFEATASWAIEAIWQRPKRLEDARLNAEGVAESLVARGLQLVADVRLAYVDAIASERSLSLANEQASTANRLAELSAGRLKTGDISEFEARLARTVAAQWEAARIARVSARDLAVLRLRSLMNLPFDAPTLQLIDPIPGAPAACGDVPALTKTALAARPDVRAAELQIDAAGARAGVEKGKIITLTAILDMNGEGREGFEMGPGLGVELPIFSQNQGGRARASADLEQASRRYLAVRAAVAADVQSAFIKLTEAREADAVLGAAIGDSLAAERRQARSMYDAGETSLLELLVTGQRLNDIEMARVEATAATARAAIRLDQAVGRSCARN